jgi:hypothetical protein
LSLNTGSIHEFAERVDFLVRKIVGDGTNAGVLERARTIVEAEFDLCRAREAKVALIERARALDALHLHTSDTLKVGRSLRAETRHVALAESSDPTTTILSKEPNKLAEAVRCVLPELLKLDRYERRASGRRDRALQDMSRIMMLPKTV